MWRCWGPIWELNDDNRFQIIFSRLLSNMRTVDSTQTFVHQFSYQNLRLSKQDTESQASVSEKQHIHCDDYSFNQ